MTTWMALFGLVWLLRVRGSLCGCAACKRGRHDPRDGPHDPHDPHDSPHDPRDVPHGSQDDPHGCRDGLHTAYAPCPSESAPFDVIALETYTRDVTVQTDFDDDEIEDLDKIEMQITEECKFNKRTYLYCLRNNIG